MTASSPNNALIERALGARGSRLEVAQAAAAADVTDGAAAVLAAIPEWWAERASLAGLTGRWLDVRSALDAEPPVFADALAPAQLAPNATATDVGTAYIAALTPQIRARHGRHYTPADLSGQLWAMTRRSLGHSTRPRQLAGLVRDPACGAGSLLIPPLREHLQALRRIDPQLALTNLGAVIEGIDADPAAVWLTNVVLAAEALPVLAEVPAARRRPFPVLAHVSDGLAEPERRARAVVMNPPYGRVKLQASERERFARYLYGHANLYGLFMAAGLDSLDDSGVLSALVPTSFTAGRYFTGLRHEFSKAAPLREVVFVAERDGVFAGVLQETCIATFTRKRARKTAVATINGHLDTIANVTAPRGGAPWLLPRRSDDAHVAAAAAVMPLSLADAGWRVSTGPLVWNRRKDDLSSKPSSDSAAIIWAADIDGGRLHRDPVRDRLRYLRLTVASDRRTMALDEPAILVQRTTSPEQTRRIVSAELTQSDLASWGHVVVVENHVNVLRPSAMSPALSQRALARVLATTTMDRVMRCLAGSVAVSAYELESLPLPDADELARWEHLTGADLEAAVAAAYRPRRS